MSKKIYAMLLPLLAVVAFASISGGAQAAEFHWYLCKHETSSTHKFSDSECQNEVANTGAYELVRLPFTSAKTLVDTFGTLTLKTNAGITVTCNVIDAGNIWNVSEATSGKDEIVEFVNFGCKTEVGTCATPEIKAKGLPWAAELAAGPVDKIKGIKVTLVCGGAEAGTVEGELKPTIANPTPTESLLATFSAATGTLTGAGGLSAEVIGSDRIVGFAHGEEIFVKAP
jgi:hypothetical protein